MSALNFLQPVTFGDCDPAGIVFYPNYFAWFDRTFHDWLRPYGGHATIVARMGAIGIGIMQVNARFHSPASDGDELNLSLSVEKWGGKTLHLSYEGRVGSRLVVSGNETRGLFMRGENGMFAAEMDGLRKVLDPNDS